MAGNKSEGFCLPEGMTQLSENQLKLISKKLSQEAENKSKDEIDSEVATALATNPNY